MSEAPKACPGCGRDHSVASQIGAQAALAVRTITLESVARAVPELMADPVIQFAGCALPPPHYAGDVCVGFGSALGTIVFEFLYRPAGETQLTEEQREAGIRAAVAAFDSAIRVGRRQVAS